MRNSYARFDTRRRWHFEDAVADRIARYVRLPVAMRQQIAAGVILAGALAWIVPALFGLAYLYQWHAGVGAFAPPLELDWSDAPQWDALGSIRGTL